MVLLMACIGIFFFEDAVATQIGVKELQLAALEGIVLSVWLAWKSAQVYFKRLDTE